MSKNENVAGPAVGSAVAGFELKDADARALASASLKGKPFVLYFYPKADTSGCTREAKEFTELMPDFAKLSMPVIAVSADPPAALAKFRKKYDLKIALASSEGSTILQDFGVWVEKSMYGRKYMGIERSTYLIDAKGRIARVWRNVKVPDHAAEVLTAAKAM